MLVVSLRVNKIEESVCASLIHIRNILGPTLGAKRCVDKGQQGRGIRLCIFNSYVQHLGPHVGRDFRCKMKILSYFLSQSEDVSFP